MKVSNLLHYVEEITENYILIRGAEASKTEKGTCRA